MDNPWIEVRNSSGHLLFRYNPFTNEVELRVKGVTYELIKLDEIRSKHIHFVKDPEPEPLATVTVPAQGSNGR